MIIIVAPVFQTWDEILKLPGPENLPSLLTKSFSSRKHHMPLQFE